MICLIKQEGWEGGSLVSLLLDIKIYTLDMLCENKKTHSDSSALLLTKPVKCELYNNFNIKINLINCKTQNI